MKEINESWYTIQEYDGKIIETADKSEAKLAIRERRQVVKNSRKLFTSGKSDIRLYVSTEITQAKDL